MIMEARTPAAGKKLPFLETRGLSVSFRNVQALKDINFKIYPGEVIGLLGDNGAGKSTLIKTIMGLYPDYQGDIFIEGRRVEKSSVHDRREDGIGVAYQDFAVIKHLKIWQNFFLGNEITKKIGPFRILNKKKMKQITRNVFKETGFDASIPVTTPVGCLSGGQRQTLAILRAYYFATRLMILDEPTASLSKHEVELVLTLVKKMKSRNIAVIFITHKDHEVFEVTDRFFVLRQGKRHGKPVKKHSLLHGVDSLLISSRVLAVQDITSELAAQFCTPLEDIRENVEDLERSLKEKPAEGTDITEELLTTILSEAKSLLSIVRHFSNFSDQPVIEYARTDLKALVKETIDRIPLDKAKGIKIKTSLREGLFCELDPELMTQVLSNLILNAIEASDENGTIEISTSEAGEDSGDVILSVSDRGRGIPSDILPNIYNPFFTTKASNSGLGLSIVYRLVEMQNGYISCRSREGEGTCFTLRLPRTPRKSVGAPSDKR
jgi:simple sugar transport system ATP-binding protein